MFSVSAVLLAFAIAAPETGAPPVTAPRHSLPVRITGPWTLEIGPGTVETPAGPLTLARAVAVEVAPPPVEQVRDEAAASLPVFEPDKPGWRKGRRLDALVTVECSATGLLDPDSLRVKPAAGQATAYRRGADYDIDPQWGTVGRLEGGAIAPDTAVLLDYDYHPRRLDSVVLGADGALRVAAGAPGAGSQQPPPLAAGDRAVVNLWFAGPTERLEDANVYPIQLAPEAPAEPETPAAETLLPRTLAKLRAGEALTVVAWGDSVTNGGGVERSPEAWYQSRFAARLAERYPRAEVRLFTAAWPGGNSTGYLNAPAGGEYDFRRDVLDRRPDLVTIEFVNDSGLRDEALDRHYRVILDHLRGIGAEVILITPHYVRPDWMGAANEKIPEDPRPYVHGLRRFAAENGVALADAARGWGRLWTQGVPYTTLLSNSINHPDARGHELFADALMGLFPDS